MKRLRWKWRLSSEQRQKKILEQKVKPSQMHKKRMSLENRQETKLDYGYMAMDYRIDSDKN